MLLRLVQGPALARELAQLINTTSNEVYPRLERYIFKGLIQKARTINRLNIYSLTEKGKQLLFLSKGSDFEEVVKKAEKKLGRNLDEEEKEVLRVFYEEKGYIEASSTESVAEKVYYKLKGKVKLYRIEQILDDLTSNHIIFGFRPNKRSLVMKAKLDRDLLH
ncbi:conjugal transfer protein [Sulfolobus acidocaldarius]|nr:conjugal transfer protein [Sulfolobus acidocaldarius]